MTRSAIPRPSANRVGPMDTMIGPTPSAFCRRRTAPTRSPIPVRRWNIPSPPVISTTRTLSPAAALDSGKRAGLAAMQLGHKPWNLEVHVQCPVSRLCAEFVDQASDRIRDLGNPTAIHADDVVVVPTDVHVLEPRLPVFAQDGQRQPVADELLQHTLDEPGVDRPIRGGKLLGQPVGGDVTLVPQEGLKNLQPLVDMPEAVLDEDLLELPGHLFVGVHRSALHSVRRPGSPAGAASPASGRAFTSHGGRPCRLAPGQSGLVSMEERLEPPTDFITQ